MSTQIVNIKDLVNNWKCPVLGMNALISHLEKRSLGLDSTYRLPCGNTDCRECKANEWKQNEN